jgi:lysozyme
MKLSKKGADFIRGFEKLALKAYPDPGSSNGLPWTIGWGTTKGVYEGMTCTPEEAEDWFWRDIEEFEDGVNSLVKVEITQGMFDALLSFGYNVGLDIDEDTKAEGLGDSTLLKKLNRGDFAGAADQFLLWDKNDGKVMRGLTRRRTGERGMFLGLPA